MIEKRLRIVDLRLPRCFTPRNDERGSLRVF